MRSAPRLTISRDSVLSHDFITSDGVLVDPGQTGQVAVFRNPHKGGAAEALVISSQLGHRNQLLYLARDTTSLTGWRLIPITDRNGGNIFALEVIAFADTWGGVDAFFVGTGGTLLHLWVDAGRSNGWTLPVAVDKAPKNLRQLRVAFSPGATTASGRVMLYAVDDKKKAVFLYSAGNGDWHGANLPFDVGTLSWTLALRDDHRWLLSLVAAEKGVARVEGLDPVALDAGHLFWIWGTFNGSKTKAEGMSFLQNQLLVATLANATNMARTDATMILGLDGHTDADGGRAVTWLIDPGAKTQTYGTVVGSSFVEATVVEGTDGYVDVYGISRQRDLYAMRQVGFNPQRMSYGYNDEHTWGPVFQLQARVAQVYATPSPSDAPALIAVDADKGELHLFQMDADTALWQAVPITLPAKREVELTRWRTEVTVLDEDGRPVVGARLTVKAASTVDVEVNGRHAIIDADKGYDVLTDGFGKATVSSLATSLATPTLTFSADGLPATAEAPAGPLNDYLAGKGELFGKRPFDEDAVRHLNNSDLKPAALLDCIRRIAELGRAAYGHRDAQLALEAEAASDYPVHVYQVVGGQMVHHRCRTRADADAITGAGEPIWKKWSDVWDKAKHFAGDVWHGITRGLHTVEKVVIDAGRRAVQLFIKIGGDFVQLADWVIHSIEDGLRAVAAVFRWMKAEIEEVLDYLRLVFDFEAIWNTKTAIASQLEKLAPYLASQFDAWSKLIEDDFFKRNKARIDGYFDALIARYGDRRFDSLPDWQPTGKAPSRTPIIGKAAPADFGDDVHANWFQAKVNAYAPATLAGAPTVSGSPVDRFFAAVLASARSLWQAITDFYQGFVKLFDPDDPSTVGQIVIGTFLAVARDLADAVLEVFDALIQGLLGVGALAVKGFATLLGLELDFGFVNDVYRWVARQGGGSGSLRVIDLFALLAAFPVTIVYKLVAGADKEPFPGGKPLDEALVDGEPSPRTRQVFGTVAGVMTAIGGIWRVATDALPEVPGWVSKASWATIGIRAAFSHPQWLDWGPLEWGSASAVAANLLWLGPVAYFVNEALEVDNEVKSRVTGKLHGIGLDDWVFDDVTKAVTTVWGLMMLGAEVYAIIFDDMPPIKLTAGLVESLVSPLAFLTMTPIKAIPVYGEIALGLKLFVDVLGTFGGGVLEVVSAFTETDAAAPAVA